MNESEVGMKRSQSQSENLQVKSKEVKSHKTALSSK